MPACEPGSASPPSVPLRIFCANGQLATGVIHGLAAAWIPTPQAAAVVGYGDLALSMGATGRAHHDRPAQARDGCRGGGQAVGRAPRREDPPAHSHRFQPPPHRATVRGRPTLTRTRPCPPRGSRTEHSMCSRSVPTGTRSPDRLWSRGHLRKSAQVCVVQLHASSGRCVPTEGSRLRRNYGPLAVPQDTWWPRRPGPRSGAGTRSPPTPTAGRGARLASTGSG